MAAPDIANTWADIRQGVKDAEILIGQKKYNLSMIKSRQVLELMVNYLCSNASVAENDLASSIDVLYDYQWISKTTCEHYHKIRMLGNKAVHEGNDDAYDANQAYHLLSQEVYTFANEYKSKKGRPGAGSPGRSGQRPAGNRNQASRNTSSRNSGGRGYDSRSSGSRNSGSRNQRGSSSRSRRRQSSGGLPVSPVDLVRLGLAVVFIIIIVVLVRVLNPGKTDEDKETSSVAQTESFEMSTEPTTTAAPIPIETTAETTAAPVYKISADVLNVRSEPSTAGQKLGTLENGTIVDYVEDYDDEWAIINYNGTEAYINKQFLVQD